MAGEYSISLCVVQGNFLYFKQSTSGISSIFKGSRKQTDEEKYKEMQSSIPSKRESSNKLEPQKKTVHTEATREKHQAAGCV